MLIVLLFSFIVLCVANEDNIEEQCRLNPHPSVEYRCLVSEDKSRPCDVLEHSGTTVRPRCRSPNYRPPISSDLADMRCVDGNWNYIARCIPECGRVTPDAKELVVGGQAVTKGELPWHAGVYKKTTSPYKQICGGSLISTNVIISAAHCFWSDLEKQLPAFQFAVAVGKLYKKWNNNLDEAQKSNVKAIHLPRRYQGAGANYQEDIAVLITSKEFRYKTYIRPVCLNFDYKFAKQQLQPGNQGKVAGWGLISASGKETPKLRVVDLPYVDVDSCIKNSPVNFREYITGDKICAGSLKPDTALCKGDSGGGLAFADGPGSERRYYLRGVVSSAASGEDPCNTNSYTSFTDVLKHEHFIKQFWTESGQFKCKDGSAISPSNLCDGARDCPDGSDETLTACSKKSCSSYLFQCAYGACVDRGATCNGVEECSDGSDEADKLCGRKKEKQEQTNRPTSNKCLLPPHPENGRYVVTNIDGAKPGEEYDLVTVNVSCLPGFHILGVSSTYCLLGRWQESMPECTNEFRSDYRFYPEGWFKVHPVPVDWRTAGLMCHFEGAELASPRKTEIVSVLKELVAKAIPKLQVYFSRIRQTFVDVKNNFELEIPEIPSKDLQKLDVGGNVTGKSLQCLVYSSDVVEMNYNCDDPLPYICFKKFSIFDELTDCGTVDKRYQLDTRTGHCYKFHQEAQSWSWAQKICRAEGGHLAIINGAAEASVLSEIVNGSSDAVESPVAIGFREWGGSEWWTIHGQTLEEAGFEDWSEGRPDTKDMNNTNVSCGSLFNGKLFDIPCDAVSYPFLCEKRIDSLTDPVFIK